MTELLSERAGSVSKVYHGDQLGSTRGLTDGTQTGVGSRDYDSFGLTVGGSGLNTPFGFVGGAGYQSDPDSGLLLPGALPDPASRLKRLVSLTEGRWILMRWADSGRCLL